MINARQDVPYDLTRKRECLGSIIKDRNNGTVRILLHTVSSHISSILPRGCLISRHKDFAPRNQGGIVRRGFEVYVLHRIDG